MCIIIKVELFVWNLNDNIVKNDLNLKMMLLIVLNY